MGDPNHLTSNTWGIWRTKSGIYIYCRDSFQDVKASLHTPRGSRPGQCRFSFNYKAWKDEPDKYHMEIWDEPAWSGYYVAFSLYFLTSELPIGPEHRSSNTWNKVIFIEAAPPGSFRIVSVVITAAKTILTNSRSLHCKLAEFNLDDGRLAQVMVYSDLDEELTRTLSEIGRKAVDLTRLQSDREIPRSAYLYALGHRADSGRNLTGFRALPFL